VICLDFGVWGTPVSGGRVGVVIVGLRTFPELVGTSVQNLLEIGLAGSRVKEGHRYKQSV